MFKLMDKVGNNKYSVLDTSDGVADILSWQEIVDIIADGIVEIDGISIIDNTVCFVNLGVKFVKVLRGSKFRIYPTKIQREQIDNIFGCTRFIWNQMLSARIEHYELTGESLDNHYNDYYEGNEFLRKVPARVLQMTERNLNTAYKNFYRRIKNGDKKAGFPKFKSRYDSNKSFQAYNDNNCIRLGKREIVRRPNDKTVFVKNETDVIKLPKIDGDIKVMLHRPITGRITTVTVSKNACDEYYVSMHTEEWVETVITPEDSIVGIDLGISALATMNDGSKKENDELLDKYLSDLRILQQKFSKTVKVSNRRNKLRKRIARLYRRIANKRLDNIHKFTHDIVSKNGIVITEDLNIKGMQSNKTHKKRKRTRDRHIANASWYEITRQLAYKCSWSEKIYKKVGRTYLSTQLCSSCGYQNKALRGNTKIRGWICPVCGSHHDRDINAAINIRNEGMRLLGIA